MTVSLLQSQRLSSIPGVVHGFTTREGGASRDHLASLNLGIAVEDEPRTVAANRAAVLDALGRPDAAWVSVRQVHGADVVEITRNAGPLIQADALWTRDRKAAVAVIVADCVPILIADASGAAVAAVHAGWRGSVARVAAVTVGRLEQAGFPPQSLRAALGPAIGPCCFVIGQEVADAITAAVPDEPQAVHRDAEGRLVADLWAVNRRILVEAGVPEEEIDTLRICTSCNPSFYSHRRDEGGTGRQAGIIAFRR